MEYFLSFNTSTGDALTPTIRAKAVFPDGSDIPFPLSDQFDVLDGAGCDFIAQKKIAVAGKKLSPDKKFVEFSFSVTDNMTSQDLLRNPVFKIKVLLYPQYGASIPGGMGIPGLGGAIKPAPLGVSECSVTVKTPVRLTVKPEKEILLDASNKSPVRYTAENQVLNPSKKTWESFDSRDYDIEIKINRTGDSGNAVKEVLKPSKSSCKKEMDFYLVEEVTGDGKTVEIGSVDAQCINLAHILETVSIPIKAVTQNTAATLEISKASWQKKSIDLAKALNQEQYKQLRTTNCKLSVQVSGEFKHSQMNYKSEIRYADGTVTIGKSIYVGVFNEGSGTLDFNIKPFQSTGAASPVYIDLPQPVLLEIDKPIDEICSNILNTTEKVDAEVKNAAVKYISDCMDQFALKDKLYLDINLEGIVRRLSVIENYTRLLSAFTSNIKETAALREKYVWRLTENLIGFTLECASFSYDAYEAYKISKAGKSQVKIAGEAIAADESRKIIRGVSEKNSILLKSANDLVADKEKACSEILIKIDSMKDSIKEAKYWVGKGKDKHLTRNGMKLDKSITEHIDGLFKLADELSKAKAEQAVKQNFDNMLKFDLLLNESLTAEEMMQKITNWTNKNARAFLPQNFDMAIHEERKLLLGYKCAGKLKELSASIDEWVGLAGTDDALKEIKIQIEASLAEIEKNIAAGEKKELAYEAMKGLVTNISKQLGGDEIASLTKSSLDTKITRQVKDTEGFMNSSTYSSKASEPFPGMNWGFAEGIDPVNNRIIFTPTPGMQDDDPALDIKELMGVMFSAVKMFGTLILEIIAGMGKVEKIIADYASEHTWTAEWLPHEKRETGRKKAIAMGLDSNYFQSIEEQKKSLLAMLQAIDNGDTSFVPKVNRDTLSQVKKDVLDSQKRTTRDYFQASELDTKKWINQAFLVALDPDKITDYENLGGDEQYRKVLELFSLLTDPLNRYKNAQNLSNEGFCSWVKSCAEYNNWTWTLVDDFLSFFDLVISNMIKLILAIVSTAGAFSFYGGITALTVASVVDLIVNFARVAVVSGLVIPYVNGLQADFAAVIGLAYAGLFENADME